MHLTKKFRSAISILALSIFCAANLCAYSINITVNDAELDFPLEGVKVSVANSSSLSFIRLYILPKKNILKTKKLRILVKKKILNGKVPAINSASQKTQTAL